MLQNKGFHLGGCMHEYLMESYDNFEVKPKQNFAQPIQISEFHWHFVNFLMTFTQ